MNANSHKQYVTALRSGDFCKAALIAQRAERAEEVFRRTAELPNNKRSQIAR